MSVGDGRRQPSVKWGGVFAGILSWISQIDPSGDWRSCDYYEYSDY